MSDAVSVHELTVHYGRRAAVDAVTLSVQPGSVYALLGRNGAGKSSLVRCLLGLQKPRSGRVELFGEDVWHRRVKLMERVGFLSEDADAPPGMTVAAIARFCSSLYSRWNQSTVDDRLRRFGVAPSARFGDLSKGEKKQVSLAMALAMSPELLVLDDPTLGLDVVARRSLFDEVISELADRGMTVFLTTHDLAGVETIADRVGVVKEGRLVLDEELESLKARFRRVRFPSAVPAIANGPLATTAVRSWGSGTEAIVSNFDELAFERFRSSAGVNGADVDALTLEEIFIAVAGEEGALP